MNQNEEKTLGGNPDWIEKLLAWVVLALHVQLVLVMHCCFGAAYPGPIAFVTLLLPYTFASLGDPSWLVCMFPVNLLLLFLRNSEARKAEKNGANRHSKDNGVPLLALRAPPMFQRFVMQVIEPLLFIVGGFFIAAEFNKPFGFYMIAVGVATFLANGLQDQFRVQRQRAINDAYLEHKVLTMPIRSASNGG